LPETNPKISKKGFGVRFLKKDGQVYEVHSLAKFAREHGLRQDCLSQLFKDKIIEHRGFKLLNPREKIKNPKRSGFVKFSKIILIHENGQELEIPNIKKKKFLKENRIDLYSLLCGRRDATNGYKLYRVFDKKGKEIFLNAK
jgi:hypothetical protein